VCESWRIPMRSRCCPSHNTLQKPLMYWSWRNRTIRFTKLDCPIWLLLETGHDIDSDLGLLTLGLILLRCNHLWTFLCVALHFIIGRSLASWPCLILIASWSINRRYTFGHPLSDLATDQWLLLPSGKTDGRVWHSGLSGFPVLKPSCSIGGQHSRNGRLLCSSIRGQNPQ
jgi:hypothetical protein